jgi:hypothetical protein
MNSTSDISVNCKFTHCVFIHVRALFFFTNCKAVLQVAVANHALLNKAARGCEVTSQKKKNFWKTEGSSKQ